MRSSGSFTVSPCVRRHDARLRPRRSATAFGDGAVFALAPGKDAKENPETVSATHSIGIAGKRNT